MLQPIIKRSYLTEVNMATVTASQKYNFDNIPELNRKDVIITGISAYTASSLVSSPNQKTVIADAAAANFVVTLATAESERIYRIPYYDLVSRTNAGLIRLFDKLNLNLTKCYVTCLNTAGVNAGESLVFNLIYEFRK